jgi:hypothetical protein
VVDGVGGGEDLGFVYVVYAQSFEDLFICWSACRLVKDPMYASVYCTFVLKEVYSNTGQDIRNWNWAVPGTLRNVQFGLSP